MRIKSIHIHNQNGLITSHLLVEDGGVVRRDKEEEEFEMVLIIEHHQTFRPTFRQQVKKTNRRPTPNQTNKRSQEDYFWFPIIDLGHERLYRSFFWFPIINLGHERLYRCTSE